MIEALRIFVAGQWLVHKATRQQAKHGTQHAAANLRKQGVPLPVARLILAARRDAS
jgi:hypothetical protein